MSKAGPLLAMLVALLLAVPLAAQQIPYEKYRLDNGLTVILHRETSLPIATVNIWYRVGAKDEPPRRSGFAHLFEHLMFMGTQRVPGNEFDIIMERGGGSNNASTSFDRTNYFSEGPSTLLPTLLWLDADRLEDVARTMTQEKLDRQRDIVRNEIRENVENTPYGRADEDIFRIMYPQGHPYHNAVYGTHEDLEAATVWDVKDFFATYYTPGNASLVVAGDFDPAAVKPLIQSLFGTLPAGAPVQHRSAPPVRLTRAVRTTMIDRVQLPLIRMTWHSPAYYAPGDAEMDLVAAVLSSGKASRLYNRLVMVDQLAAELVAHQDSAGLGSLFQIDIFAKPGADLDAIERAADEELQKLLADGPASSELDERKAQVELAKLAELQRLGRVADKLNEYEFYFGEPDSFKRDLDRYRNATPESVLHWSREVLRMDGRSIIRVLPEEPERESGPRDRRPAIAAPAAFSPQKPEVLSLSNGVRVLLWTRRELPLVSTTVVLAPGGPLAAPERAGLPSLMTDMLDEGTGDLDAIAFSRALQALGASMGANVEQEGAAIGLTSLARTFPDAATLFARAIRNPRLAEPDWARVKSLHLDMLSQQDEEPAVVAARVGLLALFGPDHPYGRPVQGTIETVSALSLDQVREAHARLIQPEFATILVSGDISRAQAEEVLEGAFGTWKAPAAANATVHSAAPARGSEGMRLYLVDRPGAVQTVIRIMAPAPAYGHEHRVQYTLLNTLLGGTFTSRLNQNLREDHGYTYGAASRFAMGRSTGYFVASTSVRTDVTGESITEMLRELERMRSGDVSEEEAGKARESLRTDTIQGLAGLGGLLNTAAARIINGVPFDSVAEDLSTMETIEGSSLNALAREALRTSEGVMVLVGDKSAIENELRELGLPAPVVVSPTGAPSE
jgi:zinc protease